MSKLECSHNMQGALKTYWIIRDRKIYFIKSLLALIELSHHSWKVCISVSRLNLSPHKTLLKIKTFVKAMYRLPKCMDAENKARVVITSVLLQGPQCLT